MSSKIVGVDVGGTFTDLVWMEEDGDGVRISKVLTTVPNQAIGVLAALEAAEADLSEVTSIVHGTTTTTNALLERKVSRCGLITTKGFRDVLELGRRTRPNPYGMVGQFEPLIPRELRLEVSERMDADGNVVTPLDKEETAAVIKKLVDLGCESLVIHFLHAYINSEHERQAAEIARELWPNSYITMGHAILSEYREYERGTTAAVNAAIQPVLHRYISRLQEELERRSYAHDLLVMQGNGGTVSSKIVSEAAVNTVMSGPASGVMAAAYTAKVSGYPNVITYDMGGTSCDVGLIQGGIPQISAELELEYAMPIHVPMVDVHSIGAGGGSIAFINDAGMLQVGPESAGADPGPICYGRGGRRPTITDANLVLGRLNPNTLLAVDNPVSPDEVKGIIDRDVGTPLGMPAEEAAAAVLQIANDRMAGALRMVSLSRGHDPRDFALFAFGGAGPLHAVALARELAVPTVIVPARPGITNAVGCIAADVRHDYVNTLNRPVPTLDMDQVRKILDSQIEEGKQTIERERIKIEKLEVIHSADMQFQGQTHILTVPVPGVDVTRRQLQEAFDKAYWNRFEVELPEIRAVLVNLHTAVVGSRKPVPLEALAATDDGQAGASMSQRQVWFEQGWLDTDIYERRHLPAGSRLQGPAVIEQLDTTILVEPGNHVVADDLGNLIITIDGGKD